LVENEQHQDVSPLERARGFKRLTDPPFNLSQDEVARRVGLERSMVSRLLSLLDEPPEIQEFLPRGKITPGHLRALDIIQDKSQRVALAEEAADKHWSVRETEKRIPRAAKGGRSRNAELAPSGSSSIWEFLQPLLRFLRVGLLLERVVRRVVSWVNRFMKRRYEKTLGSGPTHGEPTHPKKAA
jgi:ParB-like chromosome segregation protein Spo0J